MPILSTIFLWLGVPRRRPANHPAEHGIIFDVIMAPCAHTNAGFCGRYANWAARRNTGPPPKRKSKIAKKPTPAMFIFGRMGSEHAHSRALLRLTEPRSGALRCAWVTAAFRSARFGG